MLQAQTIERMRDLLARRQDVAAAYLFGSEVTGRGRRGSDVDVAIVAAQELRGMERIELETELSNLLGRDVDLVVFGQASPLLQHQILKHGRLLCERDAAERVRQEVRARAEYLDTRHLHRELRA